MIQDPFAEFKLKQREMWASFAPTAIFTTPVAGHLVKFSKIAAGETVLDVGTGTGVVALTAARAGAKVTGLDLTPELIEQARENGHIAQQDIVWNEGDAEQLPYPDVRPAWAQTCGCKSRHELITVSEVKRNCMRVTECGEEAWSVNREPMDKNRIEGAAKQGERASICKALVIKARRRKCGGCAMKECVLTWGDLASCLKGRQRKLERGVSRGRSSASSGPMRHKRTHEGPNESK